MLMKCNFNAGKVLLRICQFWKTHSSFRLCVTEEAEGLWFLLSFIFLVFLVFLNIIPILPWNKYKYDTVILNTKVVTNPVGLEGKAIYTTPWSIQLARLLGDLVFTGHPCCCYCCCHCFSCHIRFQLKLSLGGNCPNCN